MLLFSVRCPEGRPFAFEFRHETWADDEVHDALRQAQDRPIMITPGCTYDPQAVPEANLHAACAAVREKGGA